MNADVLNRTLEVKNKTDHLLNEVQVAFACSVENFENWFDAFLRDGPSEQANVLERFLVNPDTSKKPSCKYLDLYSKQPLKENESKDHKSSYQDLVNKLLRIDVEKRTEMPSTKGATKLIRSSPMKMSCSLSSPQQLWLPSLSVSTQVNTVNTLKIPARKSVTTKVRVKSIESKVKSHNSHTSLRRTTARNNGRRQRHGSNQKNCAYGRVHKGRTSSCRKVHNENSRKRQKVASINHTQISAPTSRRGRRSRDHSIKSPPKANIKKTITAIKDKQRKLNTLKKNLLPSGGTLRTRTTTSAITLPNKSLSASPIVPCKLSSPPSREGSVSPTAKMLNSLEDSDKEFETGKATFVDLVAPKPKPAPAKPVVKALINAKKAKEREEKRRLAKDRARMDFENAIHGGTISSFRSNSSQTSCKRVRVDSGWRPGTPSGHMNNSTMINRHIAAKERRKRILEEKKIQRLRTLKERELRRKTALKLKKSDMKLTKKKLRSDCFKKPKPKYRNRHRNDLSIAGNKSQNNHQDAKVSALATTTDMDMKKLFSGAWKSYSMSEPDDSDSNMSGDDSDHPGDKKIPDWARKGIYSKFVETQKRVDPDLIFGSYVNQTIDLCLLYKKLPTKKRYVRRNPSGDWSIDKLSPEENAEYKSKRGWLPATPPSQVK